MIKIIIFDLGGVILKHKASLINDIIRDMFPDYFGEAFNIWNKNKLFLNAGKINSDEFILELKENIKTDQTIKELKNKWVNLYKKGAKNLDFKVLDLIEKLKKKYKIILFTDTIEIHDQYNSTRGIYDKFHKVYKSYKEKVTKAGGKRAYLHLLKKIDVRPNQCLFIDDLSFNIKNAQNVGIKGIVYKNLSQLKDELKRNGFKID